MKNVRDLIDEFALPSNSKPNAKQLADELRSICLDLVDTDDLYEEHPELIPNSDPVVWGEASLHDRKGRPQRYWEHQKKFLRSPAKRKAWRGGRDTGKTTTVKTRILHKAFTQARKRIMLATPKIVHYAKTIKLIQDELKLSPHLCKRCEWASDEAGNIELQCTNGSVIMFRQGYPDGDNIRGEDVDLLVIDEAAKMCEPGWEACDGCLRADGDQEYEIYSNPDGRRSTTFYHDTSGRDGTAEDAFELHCIPRWFNPNWTEELKRRLIKAHGGEKSPGYLHEVVGDHGAPALPAFSPEAVNLALVPIEDYTLRRITGDQFSDLTTSDRNIDGEVRSRLDELFHDLPHRRGVFLFGADLGYSQDPSAPLIDELRPDGVLVPFLRLHLERVPYPIQAQIIAWLDRRYHFLCLGIDRGSNGIAVYQDLTMLDSYRPQRFSERLFAFDFGASLLVGYEQDKDGEDDESRPIKKFAKVHATDLINNALRDRKQLLAEHDFEQLDQLIGQTATITGNRIVYSKGNDHIADSRRCMALGHWWYSEAPEVEETRREVETTLCFTAGRGF